MNRRACVGTLKRAWVRKRIDKAVALAARPDRSPGSGFDDGGRSSCRCRGGENARWRGWEASSSTDDERAVDEGPMGGR